MSKRQVLFSDRKTTRVWALAGALLPSHGGDLRAALGEAAARYAATTRALEEGDPIRVQLQDGPARLGSALGRLYLEPVE